MSYYERFLTQFEKRYSQTARSTDVRARLSPLLVCPDKLPLPAKLKDEAERIVTAFYALRNLPEWKTRLETLHPGVVDPGNSSILMSYDFHIDEAGRLRLIEINTNASVSLISELAYEANELPNPYAPEFRKEIVASFMEEWRDSRVAGSAKPRAIAITDDNPEQQKLYIEFLMYKELFEREGIDTRVVDTKDFVFEAGQLRAQGAKIDLVYNRNTDFYFETPDTRALREAVAARAACVSPNAHEYLLLADKERLLELSKPGALESLPLDEEQKSVIRSTLIRTVDITEFGDADAIWAERKKWFFKPRRSFGGKATYRGATISRSHFNQVISGNSSGAVPYVAQELVPPPLVRLGPNAEEFKYDLRFYAYKDRVQLACARIYQGQMTNSQTPGGGIAPIEWI